jgi:hypothetical protein
MEEAFEGCQRGDVVPPPILSNPFAEQALGFVGAGEHRLPVHLHPAEEEKRPEGERAKLA